MITSRRANSPALALAGAFLILGFAALGCERVAGIEDRKLVTEDDSLCQEYCDTVLANCQGEYAVYTTEETCLGVCRLLDPGDPIEPANSNNVACRLRQAREAGRTEEPDAHCPHAGPGGGGVCGDDCEAYCELFAAACTAEFTSTDECETACHALKNQERFDVEADHGGDTLECRLVHVSSATVEPETHCAHAVFKPSEPWCIAPEEEAPKCEDYCRVALASCRDENAVYETEQQCLATCAALEPGSNTDTEENTVGCRKYHAYNAALSPDVHCSHAGPGGDGHCGSKQTPEEGVTGNCESYCRIVEQACGEEFDEEFGGTAECEEACGALEGAGPDTKYSVTSADEGGDTLNCRLLHAVRALEEATECDAAFGGSPCE